MFTAMLQGNQLTKFPLHMGNTLGTHVGLERKINLVTNG